MLTSPTDKLSRNKQIVGERLVTTGLSVAYRDPAYPSHGPVVKALSRDAAGLHLEYDREISYDQEEISGFYFCCLPFDRCDDR